MSRTPPPDRRPPVWVGHVVLAVPDVGAAHAFFLRLGMRDRGRAGPVALLELRGGTHLVLLPGGERVQDEEAPFDLMVDDLRATRARYASAGLDPTPIARNRFHRFFTVTAPSGHRLTINSSHVGDDPV